LVKLLVKFDTSCYARKKKTATPAALLAVCGLQELFLFLE